MNATTTQSSSKASRWVRAQIIEGSHLHSAFSDPAVQQLGYRIIHRAKRVARRLRIDERSLPSWQ